MDDLTFHHAAKMCLAGSDVMRCVAQAWAELCSKGYSGDNIPVHTEYQIIWATPSITDRTVMGIIVYWPQEHSGDVWINLTWVPPTLRRKGIFGALYTELKTRCSSYRTITGGIHPTNLAAQYAAKAMGRSVAYVAFTERLQP